MPLSLAFAQSIYDECAFDRLPILADACQEAGCQNSELLQHCRSQRVHVRGCWAVDSAVTLACPCGEYREAERLITTALSGTPPETIAEELRDLLLQEYFKQSPRKKAPPTDNSSRPGAAGLTKR